MKHIKQKQHTEFSKKIYILNIILVIIVVLISFGIIIFSGQMGITDLSPLPVICTAAFAELGLHTAGYQIKAKAENVLKISRQIAADRKNNIVEESDYIIASKIMNGNTNEWSDE